MQLLLVVPRAGRAGVLGAEIQHIPRAQGKYHSYYHVEYHVHLFDSFIIILGFSLFLHCLIITMFFYLSGYHVFDGSTIWFILLLFSSCSLSYSS